MYISRRRLLEGAAVLALSAAVFGSGSIAVAQTPSAADLARPGPLGDFVQGKADAPVTIIEYASMTCSHCADFHVKTYPELKSRYIDTGKVRFILREFPLDPLATGAFMLARCAGQDKYYAAVDVLFAQQRTWAVQKPIEPLMTIAKQFGINQQAFEKCLSDQKVVDALEAGRQFASEKLGVNSTPTFFINGKVQRGFMSINDIAKIVDPLLKS